MLNFMKKIPAGTLLLPMFLSALINTIWPNVFDIGGATEAIFGGGGVNFIVGLLSFISASMLDLKVIGQVMKKQGAIILVKIIVCIIAGFLVTHLLGTHTIFGVSGLAIIVALCSTNPAMYLALVNDYGRPIDAGAFGLVGLISVPAFPMFVYGIAQGGAVDWLSLFSATLPIIVGLILGILDYDFRTITEPALGILMPFLGWGLGASIDLASALKAGLSGVVLVVILYATVGLILYGFERLILKTPGGSSVGMTSVGGISLAAPAAIAATHPSLVPLVADAVAQLSFAVVISSIIVPILVGFVVKRNRHEEII